MSLCSARIAVTFLLVSSVDGGFAPILVSVFKSLILTNTSPGNGLLSASSYVYLRPVILSSLTKALARCTIFIETVEGSSLLPSSHCDVGG
jgi:hypothetical protein